jgi:hypothetical protein
MIKKKKMILKMRKKRKNSETKMAPGLKDQKLRTKMHSITLYLRRNSLLRARNLKSRKYFKVQRRNIIKKMS